MNTIQCSRCNGDGYIMWEANGGGEICPMCNGDKQVSQHFANVAVMDNCDGCGARQVYCIGSKDEAGNNIMLCWKCWKAKARQAERDNAPLADKETRREDQPEYR